MNADECDTRLNREEVLMDVTFMEMVLRRARTLATAINGQGPFSFCNMIPTVSF